MTGPIRPSTLDAILEAAFATLSQSPSASIADIAARAGVGRATLHRHFPARSDLVRALTLKAIEETDAAAEAAEAGATSHGEALRLILEAIIPLGDRYGFLSTTIVDDDPEIAAHLARQSQETQDLIEAAKAEGSLDPNAPTDWVVQVYDHLIFAGWESIRAREATPSQAALLAWRTFTLGLGVKRP
ncbi:MAG: helix-turn-helix domain-containing protein [Pseudomonadota bacterium]